jgi:S-adenosylmethionine:tRNA ribosyltransferase-isomerase
MKLSEIKYDLPEDRIAQYPSPVRDESKLLVINRSTGQNEHLIFKDIINYLQPGDGLVINETKVFPARIFGKKENADVEIELLLLRQLDSSMWEVLVKPARKIRIGNRIQLTEDFGCEIIDNTSSGGRVVKFDHNGHDFFKLLEQIGRSPLPPYINREADENDRVNYQTVYAREVGAVAAPTAGLHFTQELLEQIEARGVHIIPVVLHVGLGTFRPIQVEEVSRHQMESEFYRLTEESARKINQVKDSGGKIIAVGTTSVRALETCATADNHVKAGEGWTNKFIHPPYEFKIIDSLITNFHLSGSTLFLLVSALAGKDRILAAYREAIADNYRFYSYGDAMFIR